MIENRLDRVHNKIDKRLTRALNIIRKTAEKERPYRTEELSFDEELYYYDHLSQQDMAQLIMKHGEQAVNDYIRDMETRRNG